MSKGLRGLLLSGAMGMGVAAYAQHGHGMSGGAAGRAEPVAGPAEHASTVVGEVVDMSCYLGREERGAAHADCARACLRGGGPAGLLGADGSLTLLIEDHGAKKAYRQALELAGALVEVTGKRAARGGVRALAVLGVANAQRQEPPAVYVCPMGDYRGPMTADGRCPSCGMELEKE